MRIDKEKFNKLKQLDRIEFRQKLDKIEKTGISFGNLLFFTFTITIVFIVGGFILVKLDFIDNPIVTIALTLMNLSLFLIVVEVLCILGSSFYRSKLKRELCEEYFVVEVKK